MHSHSKQSMICWQSIMRKCATFHFSAHSIGIAITNIILSNKRRLSTKTAVDNLLITARWKSCTLLNSNYTATMSSQDSSTLCNQLILLWVYELWIVHCSFFTSVFLTFGSRFQKLVLIMPRQSCCCCLFQLVTKSQEENQQIL